MKRKKNHEFNENITLASKNFCNNCMETGVSKFQQILVGRVPYFIMYKSSAAVELCFDCLKTIIHLILAAQYAMLD